MTTPSASAEGGEDLCCSPNGGVDDRLVVGHGHEGGLVGRRREIDTFGQEPGEELGETVRVTGLGIIEVANGGARPRRERRR